MAKGAPKRDADDARLTIMINREALGDGPVGWR